MASQEQSEQSSYVDYQPTRRALNKDAVERLLQLQEELRQKHPGVVFEDSVETLRQAREERMKQLEECQKPTTTPTNADPTQTTQ